MEKIFRLTESEMNKIVKKILNERDPGDGQSDDFSNLIAQFGKTPNDDLSNQENLTEYDRPERSSSRKGIYEMEDLYSRIKSCYDKTNATRQSKGQKKLPYPTECQKGITGGPETKVGCISQLWDACSKDAGDNGPKTKLYKCLVSLDPKIKNKMQGWG